MAGSASPVNYDALAAIWPQQRKDEAFRTLFYQLRNAVDGGSAQKPYMQRYLEALGTLSPPVVISEAGKKKFMGSVPNDGGLNGNGIGPDQIKVGLEAAAREDGISNLGKFLAERANPKTKDAAEQARLAELAKRDEKLKAKQAELPVAAAASVARPEAAKGIHDIPVGRMEGGRFVPDPSLGAAALGRDQQNFPYLVVADKLNKGADGRHKAHIYFLTEAQYKAGLEGVALRQGADDGFPVSGGSIIKPQTSGGAVKFTADGKEISRSTTSITYTPERAGVVERAVGNATGNYDPPRYDGDLGGKLGKQTVSAEAGAKPKQGGGTSGPSVTRMLGSLFSN